MNRPIPKRQHFVPQMMLRRFADVSGKLFFFSKQFPAKGVLAMSPRNLFCQNHLYTAKDRAGGTDVKLEQYYADLEALSDGIIEKIVTSARAGHDPHLTAQERQIWDLFFYNQWERVPDFHQGFFEDDNFGRELEMAKADFETKFRALTPDEERYFRDPSLLERVKQNAKVTALTRSSARILNFLGGKGLGIAIICKPGKSFVIGSFPVVKLSFPGRSHIADPTVEIWLPIAHDVVVSPAPLPSIAEKLIEIHDDLHIRAINTATFKQSTAIAGRSKTLIQSLVHRR